MTSLHNSVLGNTASRFDPLPEEALTMAERFHRAGYRTAVFTANAWAGSMSSLGRGVDVMRDVGAVGLSSIELHDDYWSWRDAYPGAPCWVHFQTTDVHEPFRSPPHHNGLFAGPGGRDAWRDRRARLESAGGYNVYSDAYERLGIDRVGFTALSQSLYDENMAANDLELRRLVERLKATANGRTPF